MRPWPWSSRSAWGRRAAASIRSGTLMADEGVQGRQRQLSPRRTGRRRPRSTRRRCRATPNYDATPTSSSATATTTCTSRPARARPTNDAYIQKAIDNYQKAADKDTDPADARSWRSQYLVAAYGPDKLNDPAQGRADRPGDDRPSSRTSRPTTSALSKLYEDGGRYDEAEQALQQGARRQAERPDPSTRRSSGYYNRQGDFHKTIDSAREGRRARAEQPRGLPPRRDVLLGEGPQGLPPLRRRQEGLHR